MRFRITLAGALLCGLVAAPSVGAVATSVEEAQKSAPSLKLKKRSPEKFKLKNGMQVYYLESKRLPLVAVRAVVRAGAIWEPADRSGVADLTGRMLRVGGTSQLSADQVDEELDFLAAQLGTNIGDELGNLTLNVLSENLEAGLEIFAQVARRPAFSEDKMEVQKNLIKEGIRRQNDNPIQVAIREYGYLLWGEDHPRARTPTEESVDALTRADIVAFHKKFFQPENIEIGIAGNVSKKEAKKLLNRAFGDWRGQPVNFPEVSMSPKPAARAAFADKEIVNSTILIGHLGPKETDPMRAAGEVMMSILGSGGFTSYIVDRVRNDEGLAYASGGFLAFGNMDRGNMITFAISKSETSCQAAELILEQIDRIQGTPVTDEELTRARDGILNSQAFNYDSTSEVVANLMNLAYYGFPEDHDEKIIERIGKVTKADVQEAANRVIDKSKLTMLAVGNSEALDCSWEKFAEQLGVELERIELE